ncbi:MAG: haloalkane dehalogenase [Gammaproteobacteria bacterium]|nr:haloalkane dehalogenase [Gammaproteobacteria bacterium]NNL12015.1 haloalkane dehalogenase [Pseudomonadales bacterium]NNM12477.1 haloalkane dehalogenase [Pseudomonadales bacterium]
MKTIRTPDQCFSNLPGYDFSPHYCDVDIGIKIENSHGGNLRVHYLDEGPRDGEPVLLMHGEPSWCYLYRKMIPLLADAGYRAIAVDLVGFGRSDKPVERSDYSYARHVAWMQNWLEQMQLRQVTLVCQDWGGLIGLRLVAANPDIFARVVAANTMLPTGDHDPGDAFKQWRAYSQTTEHFDCGAIVSRSVTCKMSQAEIDAYNAPFPDDSYKAGARQFPMLVPASAADPERDANLAAWEVLRQWQKPFFTAFSDSDPVTGGGEKVFQKLVPGCKGQAHVTVKNGGHFLQEDQGEALAKAAIDFMRANPF